MSGNGFLTGTAAVITEIPRLKIPPVLLRATTGYCGVVPGDRVRTFCGLPTADSAFQLTRMILSDFDVPDPKRLKHLKEKFSPEVLAYLQ
jgi:hypothetical protein